MPAACPDTASYKNRYAGCTCTFGLRSSDDCLVTLQLTGLCIVVDPQTGQPASGSIATAGCAPLPLLPDGATVYRPSSYSYSTSCFPWSAGGLTPFVFTALNLTATTQLQFSNFSVELRSAADPHAVALGLTGGSLDFGSSPDALARDGDIVWAAAGVCSVTALAMFLCVGTAACDGIVGKGQSYLEARRVRLQLQREAAAAANAPGRAVRLEAAVRDRDVDDDPDGIRARDRLMRVALLAAPPEGDDDDGGAGGGRGAGAGAGRGRGAGPAAINAGTGNVGTVVGAAARGAGGKDADDDAAASPSEWQTFLRQLPAPAGTAAPQWAAMSIADRELALAALTPEERGDVVLTFAPGGAVAAAARGAPPRFISTFGLAGNEGRCSDRARTAVALPVASCLGGIGALQRTYRQAFPCCRYACGLLPLMQSPVFASLLALAVSIAATAVAGVSATDGESRSHRSGFVTTARLSSGSCGAPQPDDTFTLGEAADTLGSALPELRLAYTLFLSGLIPIMPAGLTTLVFVVASTDCLEARRGWKLRSLLLAMGAVQVVATLCTGAAAALIELQDLQTRAAAAFCALTEANPTYYEAYCSPDEHWIRVYAVAPFVQGAAAILTCWAVFLALRR